MVRDDDKHQSDDVTNGYYHLLGNAIRRQASSRSMNRSCWCYMFHVMGFLVALNCSNPRPTWNCTEVEGVMGFRHVEKGTTRVRDNFTAMGAEV